MAIVNFSVPDEVRDAFNKAFRHRNQSAIIAASASPPHVMPPTDRACKVRETQNHSGPARRATR